MGTWGPEGKRGAVAFSFDNMGEAAELEYNLWPAKKRVGFHPGVFDTLPFLLDTLEEFGMRASFFLEAWNVEHYPDAVRAIAAAGHEINSHAYRHETWFVLPEDRQIEILEKAHKLFESVGVRPRGFRPPGGISMSATEAYAPKLGYIFVSPVGGVAGVRNGIGVIPSEMYGTDVTYYMETFGRFRPPQVAASSETEAFEQGFRLMLDAIAASGDCRSPVSHITTPLDSPARRATFRKLCEMTVNDDRLWKPTVGEAAQWMLDHPGDFPSPALRSFEPDWDPRTFGIHEDA